MGNGSFFETLFKQAFLPAQPDLFMADEIERLRLAPPDREAANEAALLLPLVFDDCSQVLKLMRKRRPTARNAQEN